MPPAYTLQESTQKLVPSTSLLTNAHERHAVLAHLAQLHGLPRITSFPGGHPATVSRSDVGRMRSERCMFALKTDGVRYLLLLCTLNGAFRAVMVDRCLRMYEVIVYANEDFFSNRTLLDGELVLDHRTNRMVYQVFDVVCMQGRRFRNEAYCDRLQVIHERLLSELPDGMSEDSEAAEDHIAEEDKIYAASSNRQGLSIVPKRFVASDNAHALWEGRNAYPFPTDGLIVNFDHSPIQSGTLRTVLKWKPHNAIDVAIDVKSLAVVCRNAGVEERLEKLRSGGRTYRVVLEDNHLVQWLLHRKGDRTHWLIECLVELRDDRAVLWPMKERSDKVEANDIRIIESTLDTISENVSLDELLGRCEPPSDCAPAADRSADQGADRSDEANRPRRPRSAKRPGEHNGLLPAEKRVAADRAGSRPTTRTARRRAAGKGDAPGGT